MSLEITLEDLKQAVNESYDKKWWNDSTPMIVIAETVYQYLTDSDVGGMGMLTTSTDASKIENALSNSVVEAKEGLPNGLVCKGTGSGSTFPEKINNCLVKYMGVQSNGSVIDSIPEIPVKLSVPLPSKEQIVNSINDLINSPELENCFQQAVSKQPENEEQFFTFMGDICMDVLKKSHLSLFPEVYKFKNPNLIQSDKELVNKKDSEFTSEVSRLEKYLKDRFGGAPSSTVPASSSVAPSDYSSQENTEIPVESPNSTRKLSFGERFDKFSHTKKGGVIVGITLAVLFGIITFILFILFILGRIDKRNK